MSGYWPPSAPGLDPDDYTDGQTPVKNDTTGLFEPGTGGGGTTLSDADPAGLGTAAPGTSTEASRADHVHSDVVPIGSVTGLVVSGTEPASPQDGWVWFDTNTETVKVRVAGAWVTFGTAPSGTARLTEAGVERVTEDGATRILEGV